MTTRSPCPTPTQAAGIAWSPTPPGPPSGSASPAAATTSAPWPAPAAPTSTPPVSIPPTSCPARSPKAEPPAAGFPARSPGLVTRYRLWGNDAERVRQPNEDGNDDVQSTGRDQGARLLLERRRADRHQGAGRPRCRRDQGR